MDGDNLLKAVSKQRVELDQAEKKVWGRMS